MKFFCDMHFRTSSLHPYFDSDWSAERDSETESCRKCTWSGFCSHQQRAAFEAVSALNQNCSAPLLKVELSVSDSFLKRAEYTEIALEPQGVDFGIFTDRDQRSILGVLNFENLYFWVLVTAAVFFGLLNKSCILKCFIFSTVFFRSSFIHQMLQ